jgi:hypothetical protein
MTPAGQAKHRAATTPDYDITLAIPSHCGEVEQAFTAQGSYEGARLHGAQVKVELCCPQRDPPKVEKGPYDVSNNDWIASSKEADCIPLDDQCETILTAILLVGGEEKARKEIALKIVPPLSHKK